MKRDYPTPVITGILEGKQWVAECDVCGQQYPKGAGSTPCCGSTQRIIQGPCDEPPASFKAALREAMIQTACRLMKDGTTGVSVDCWFQNLDSGSLSRRADAPRGTNATWQVRQLLGEILASDVELRMFVLRDDPMHSTLVREAQKWS